MALDKQVNIYSVDTSAFYDSYERKQHLKIIKLKEKYNEIVKWKDRLDKWESKLLKTKIINITEETQYKIDRYYTYFKKFKNIVYDMEEKLKLETNMEVARCKANLINHFAVRKLRANYYGYSNYRNMNRIECKEKNVISMFESSMTRTFKMFDRDKVYDDIIIVRVYYFEVLKDLIDNGFNLNGEKYIYYSSSAGMIRTKKGVFIKEKLWKKYQNTLTCGLTIEKINELGGMNVNKYLSYMALISSATEPWKDFDIDKAIVVDDFETPYNDYVDYIDYNDYSIKRKKMNVMIPHTDGIGIMLKGTNRMCRIPFVKGLMAVTPFDTFCREQRRNGNKTCGIIKDIYGKEYDVLDKEHPIEYIFTKSQFKMWKYFTNDIEYDENGVGTVIKTGWEKYQENFHKYNCEACMCNEEEEDIPNAKINYQMLQTLSDMTDNEIKQLCKETQNDIDSIGNDRRKMLELMGVTDNNPCRESNLQKCLRIYPELLKDVYLKETLKQTKASLVKDAYSGRVKINGKYTFVCPDLYGFMEWLFLGIENPKGILDTGEVYCNLFDDGKDLCCLRSPHLYHEWVIRKNTLTKKDDKNNEIKMKKWFKGKAIYTSMRDLISKILQFDVDGDHLLVIDDKLLVNIANRNRKMYDFVPLYYDMKKADATKLTNDSIYNGLISAFTGGNIGIISNNISKMWNKMKKFNRNMTAQECYDAYWYNVDTIKAIKLMCMENNFVIDYAKTLFKPTRPKEIDELIKGYTKLKLPHFFKYAKDKDDEQIDDINASTVNMFKKLVKNTKINFNATNLGEFDYRLLMNNPETEIDKEIIKEYKRIIITKKFISKEVTERKNKDFYINTYIKNELLKVNKDKVYITDVLIKQLFEHNSVNKNTLFDCFGDVIYNNLKNNIDTKTYLCDCCGKRFIKKINNQNTCSEKCAKVLQRIKIKEWKIKQLGKSDKNFAKP